MRFMNRCALIAVMVLVGMTVAGAEGELRFADIGEFSAETGQWVRHLRLGFRTFGKLNGKKSNAVVFPTWLAGTSKALANADFIGPGKMVDSSKYFVIAIDNPGNGVSLSPSNCGRRRGNVFPALSMADMVSAQHRLVTKRLGIRKLHAVVGISMGGMQAMQWAVAYPESMDKAVAIVGTPKLTSYDLMLWRGQRAIIAALRGKKGDRDTAMRLIAPFHVLVSRTPGFLASDVPTEKFNGFIEPVVREYAKISPDDWDSQVRAIMTHDVTKPYEGSMEKAAERVRAAVMVVVSPEDHMVYPGPALEFAGLVKAEVVTLSGKYGHFSFVGDRANYEEKVRQFLDK